MSLTKVLLSTSFFMLANLLVAQAPPPPATPIDGGLGILLAGGAAYGIKKLRDSKRQ